MEKVLSLSRLVEPAWGQNFGIAASWARRHFGRRLRQATLDDVPATLRCELDEITVAGGSLPLSGLQPPPSGLVALPGLAQEAE